jgi:hypothetical protein
MDAATVKDSMGRGRFLPFAAGAAPGIRRLSLTIIIMSAMPADKAFPPLRLSQKTKTSLVCTVLGVKISDIHRAEHSFHSVRTQIVFILSHFKKSCDKIKQLVILKRFIME